MKISALATFLAIGAMGLEGAAFVSPAAAFPAYYFKFRQTRLPYDSCPSDAKRTVSALGLQNNSTAPYGAGGTTNTVRAYILCTRIAKGGPCGRDGATVVFMSAGDNGPDATALLDRMDSTFGNSVLIDCN
jgi:hypothetical protein